MIWKIMIVGMAVWGALFTEQAVAMPREQLAVVLHPEAGRLSGVATIAIDAEVEVALDFSGIALDRVVVDQHELAVTEDMRGLQLVAAQQPYTVTIDYHKVLSADGPDDMLNERGVVLLHGWHPRVVGDAIYSLRATIPADFTAISEANRVEVQPAGAKKVVRFVFNHPLSGVSLVAGPYEEERIAFADGKTLYSYFFPEDRKLAAHYRRKAVAYLERYAEMLGEYPYERFSIVENLLPTGYAFPTFTLLGRAVVRLPFIVDTSLGHEILHSWFGNSIGLAPGSGNWAEGLTTYLADQAFAADRNEDVEYRKGQLVRYESYVNSGNARSLQEFFGADGHGGDRANRAMGYDKASMVFHMLHQQLGDAVFVAGLRDFVGRMTHQRAGWIDLQTSFEEQSNSSLAGFFDQWLARSDVPELAVTNLSLSHDPGYPVVRMTLVQKNEKPYALVVPITFTTPSGRVAKIIQTDSLQKAVEIPLAETPLQLQIDPEYHLMRRLDGEELPAVWSRFLGAEKKLAVLASAEERARFGELIAMLEGLQCAIKNADQVTEKELADQAVLFLGVEQPLVRALFARVPHPEEGFWLAMRPSPLAAGQVVGLISAATAREVARAVPKLSHYGKYSTLHFVDGRIRDKEIAATTQGIVWELDAPPTGIQVGTTQTFAAIMDQLRDKRVVYVGEGHTTWQDHQLQLRVIRALYGRRPQLAIGMEMFSRRAQPALDAYIAGSITEQEMLRQADYFGQWSFDYRLYRDILRFARRHRVPVLGLNIDKKLVGKVFQNGGVDALSEEERRELVPDRDLAAPGYQERLAAVFSMHGRHGQQGSFAAFLQSQALWDETMAATAAAYLTEHPERQLVVLAGRGHVVKKNAIPPRLARRLDVEQAVLVNNQYDDPDPEFVDYVLFSPPAMLPPAPLLGVQLMERDGGVVVSGFGQHSSAQQAGVEKGDRILAVDGKVIDDIAAVKIHMLEKEKGDKVVLRVLRGGLLGDRTMEFTVSL